MSAHVVKLRQGAERPSRQRWRAVCITCTDQQHGYHSAEDAEAWKAQHERDTEDGAA